MTRAAHYDRGPTYRWEPDAPITPDAEHPVIASDNAVITRVLSSLHPRTPQRTLAERCTNDR